MNSPRMKHKSSLSMQAASPNSKIYALNTQIHHARQSNNQLRQLVQEKQHVLRRTKAKSDALRCNLNSLHRETLRTTSNHAKNTKATSISSKQCVTLQHKITKTRAKTLTLTQATQHLVSKIKQEEHASIQLKRLSVGIRSDLVKQMRLLASKKQILSSLKHQSQGSTAKFNHKNDIVTHKTKVIVDLLKDIERLSKDL